MIISCVIPANAGIQRAASAAQRPKNWIPASAGMTLLLLLTACAHQADLKTPTQAAIDAKKAEAKAAKRAAQKAKEEKPAPAAFESQEVTVP